MKKLFILAILIIAFMQNNFAQMKLMYMNIDGSLSKSNNIDFTQTSAGYNAIGFTTMADIGNYSILYYSISTGEGAVFDRDNAILLKNGLKFATGWTSIVKLNKNRILFYNKTSGKAVITNNTNFNTIDEPGFSPWTHITPINNDLLCFYNDQTGMTLVTDMNFNNISPIKYVEKGYTQITDISNNNILFYNKNNGNNLTYTISLAVISGSAKGFSAGWTNIVNAGDNKIIFYNYDNDVTVTLDYNLSNQVNLSAFKKCRTIIAYDNITADQEKMMSYSMYTGGSISGYVHLPQEVLQNSTIWADYKIQLYEVIDAPNDITKYTLKAIIKISNTATLNDLPAGSNAYDIPYKFIRVPINKRFIVVFGNIKDYSVKVDLQKPLYVAIENQRNYNLIGAYFTYPSVGCRDCFTPVTFLINANDNRVKICTKAVPNIVNDIEMVK